MFDPITAEPRQLAAHIRYLSNQYDNIVDVGCELFAQGEDTKAKAAAIKANTLAAELSLCESLFNISYRDELINHGISIYY